MPAAPATPVPPGSGGPAHRGCALTEAGPAVTSTLPSTASTAPAPTSRGAVVPGVGLRLVAVDGRPGYPAEAADVVAEVRGVAHGAA